MAILFYIDTHEAEMELSRIERMPDKEMRALLDAVLETGYKATQVAVHVDTASLKTSGDHSSKVSKAKQQWEGNISYGGPSLSVNNPVDYAIYEQRRGDTHDFMAPTILLGPLYISALLKGMAKS